MGFKLRSKGPFKMMGSTPAKHTTNRIGHERKYGKGHENDAHPTYWKKKKVFAEDDEDDTWIASDKEMDLFVTTNKREDDDEKNPYRAYKGGEKEAYDFENVLEKRTDADISRSQRGKKHVVTNVGDDHDYDVTEVKKDKTEKKTEKKSTSKKKVSYEASYTDAVAEKWKDKGGKEAYIKAAKAYNAKKNK